MAQIDYYEVLGVSRSAETDEIRKAYKKLSGKYHPDRNPDDQKALEKYKQIQEAWSVLKDPEKRKKYDLYGSAWEHVGKGPGGQSYSWSNQAGGSPEDFFGGAGVNLEELLGQALGGGFRKGGFGSQRTSRPVRPEKGQDINMEITIPFTLAVEGGEYSVRISKPAGIETIDVKIPAGVEQGSVIRLAGEGHASHTGGASGDLRLKVKITPHPYFQREGNRLLLEVPLTPWEAALGAKVEVPTLNEGKVVLTIPPGTSSGQKLRLKEKGVPDRKTRQRGDLIVIANIVIRPLQSDEERKCYEKLQELSTFDARENLW